jgi:hypothetical protein
MLTRKGTADGTCGGQEIGRTAIWGVSIYVKEGEAWKFAFGMNLSAMGGLIAAKTTEGRSLFAPAFLCEHHGTNFPISRSIMKAAR